MSVPTAAGCSLQGRRRVKSRAACAASAYCLLLVFGPDGVIFDSPALAFSTPSCWAAPVDEAPAFVSDSSNLDLALADVRFVAQGWRWSPGSTAWTAVLVRLHNVRTVGLARIGGRYGP